MKIKIPYQDKITLGYSLARSAGFAAQQWTLPLIEFVTTGAKKTPKDLELRKLRLAYRELFRLLKKDSENIVQGIYPVEVLKPEILSRHFLRFPRIIYDGYSVAQRRKDKSAHDFNAEAEGFLKDLPEYYQRNFHFQSGGYLTRESAELYEHQVEILFSGSADAMRRLILPLAKQVHLGDGAGLHFLEVGAGTGRLTRFVKLAYPQAKITVMDLSYPYLKKAQENLQEFNRLDFVQGAAEELPFQDQKFDFVYSCFLFHELPHEIRRRVVAEGFRVLKAGGAYGMVDSLQEEDTHDFEWALEQFPVDFHEPFYKNYIQNPMEGLLIAAGFEGLHKDQGFFAKTLIARKPSE